MTFVERKCWIFTFKDRYTFLQDTPYRYWINSLFNSKLAKFGTNFITIYREKFNA